VSRRTEIAYENSLSGVRCPFSVNDRAILLDVQTELEISFSEGLIASFVFLYGILQVCKRLMPMGDSRKKGFEPRIEVEDGFLVECHVLRNWKSDGDQLKYMGRTMP
jgi:hypothetical protein